MGPEAGDWIRGPLGFLLAGIVLPYYFYVLIVCVAICALLTWNDYENRVAAFVLSFSAWFALKWAVVITVLSRPPRFDTFSIVTMGLMSLTFAPFAVCAVASSWLYFTRRPIEPESKAAVQLGVMLLAAHGMHLILATFFTALATD